jgi:hypothetical protein
MQMATRNSFFSITIALLFALVLPFTGGMALPVSAQAPAARQLGTVKSVSADSITLATDAGQTVTVSVPADAKIVKLAAGSTDLKTAQPSQIGDIAVGDRVLASGKAGDTPETLTAARLVVMKSSDIAQKNAAEQANWRANGTGGIVSAIDPASGTIMVTAGTKKVTVTTSSKTSFKRFVGDSVKYQDAKPSTLAQIHVGDQLQARGQKSEDGTSVQAEEVLSGSFTNLSGLVITVDQTAHTITLKDLATKKLMTVNVTANSDIRKMPPQMAQAFAARTSGGGQGGRGTGGGGGAGQGSGANAGGGGQAGGGGGYGGGGGQGGGMRRAGADLSQMIGRLPTSTLADLNKGDAVMIVASEAAPGSTTVTAITLLSGVEPILTANPNGGMDLSGWSMGGAPGGTE